MSQVHVRRGISAQLLLQQQNSCSSLGCSCGNGVLIPAGTPAGRGCGVSTLFLKFLWCLSSRNRFPACQVHSFQEAAFYLWFQYFCSQLSQLSLILPPAISPHPWNMGGHSDTEIQKIFHKGFCARSAPGFQKMTFPARIKMWIWCCKGALHSSPPQKRDVIPFLPHCSFLPSWCLLAQQPLPGVGGALDPKPVVTRVQCTNICVGSRPGAVSGAGTGQGGLGLVTHPPIAQRWIPEADRAVLTSSSPGALLLFLTSPSWVCHHEPWAGNKTKTDPVWDWAAAFIRVQTLITLKWSNVCQLLV